MMSKRKVPVLDVKGRRMRQKSLFPGAGMEGAGRREGGRARGFLPCMLQGALGSRVIRLAWVCLLA